MTIKPSLISRALICLAGLSLAGSVRGDGISDRSRAGWYPFLPTNTNEAGVLGMADWLDAPAGRHGFLKRSGERFVFEDGTPIKFWGTNTTNLFVAPAHELAEAQAAFFAKWGINAIRFHKFTWPVDDIFGGGIGSKADSLSFDPAALERMDYYFDRLKTRGIYVTWSPIWGHRLSEADRNRVKHFEEIVSGPAEDPLSRSTYGVVNLFEDLQAVNIRLVVNLLDHRNPYTSLRYADDPALAYIELQNEDNAFWVAGEMLQHMPGYKHDLAAAFCDWLRIKYTDETALLAAWGPAGLNLWPDYATGESLARNTIYPVPDRRLYQPAIIAASPAPQRLLDCLQFLFERQLAFYQRFVAAIRATGYRGEIVASNWIADDGLPHYYNLLSDHLVGAIDRHNYFGSSGHRIAPGEPFGATRSELALDDLGLISVGLAQTADRPFSLSEWSNKPPNEWVAEGPPLVAFYGMGLQGWDASFHYTARYGRFSRTIAEPNNYNTNAPSQLGQFPFLARAIHRGDVAEGAPILPRRQISLENLHQNQLGFTEQSLITGDINSASGTVPALALSIGRVELEFTERPAPLASAPDISRWIDGSIVRSNTGELIRGRDTARGWCTLNTAATKALVGQSPGRVHHLGEIALSTPNETIVLLLTARERNQNLATDHAVIVAVLGRSENSGMRYNADRTVVEEIGQSPVLMEPVRATLVWSRLKGAIVHVLDHDGRRTGHTAAVSEAGRVELDTGRDRTPFYEISWD